MVEDDSRRALQVPLTDDADGPPNTVWGVAAFLVAVIPAYSWLFKTIDESDFPETFRNPLYWIFFGLLCLIAGVWALIVGTSLQKRLRISFKDNHRTFNSALMVGLFIVFGVALILAFIVRIEAKPKADKFTVVFFAFTGDDKATESAASSFQRMIVRRLAREYHQDIVCLARERKIKGETLQEQLENARKWASRGSGCNLAVWANVEMDEDGQRFVGTIHYLKVSPLGEQSNSDILGVFNTSGEWRETFAVIPVGAGVIGKEQVDEAADSIELAWGLASYERGDYNTALQHLPSRFPNAEFYAGHSSFLKASSVTDADQLLEEAIQHFSRAIEINGYEQRTAVDDKHTHHDLTAA